MMTRLRLSLVAALMCGCATMALAQDNPMVGGAEMPATNDIVTNALNSADHTTLVAAVQAAGLVETLQGAGPFTVFAPTNEAFAALPAGTVDTLLLPESKDMLTTVLTCHVVAGDVTSAQLMEQIEAGGGSATLDTVGGCPLTATMNEAGDGIVITDENGTAANVTIADVKQSNGEIHVIDAVLTPKAADAAGTTGDSGTVEDAAMTSASMDTGNNPMVGGAAMYPSMDIIDNAVNSADHTTLVAAVQAAGLVETLKGPGPFTVFAPTNEAFAALPAGTVDTLLMPENKDQLVAVLTAHVVAGAWTAERFQQEANADGFVNLQTVSGDALSVQVKGSGNLYVYDESGDAYRVSIPDVMQSNGVIQVVDGVLLPR